MEAIIKGVLGIVVFAVIALILWKKLGGKKGDTLPPDSAPPKGPLKSKEVKVGPVKIKEEYYSPQELAPAEPTLSSEGETNEEKEARTLLEKGNEFCDNGDFDSAIDNYTKAIDKNPRYADAFNNRGLVYYFLKDCDPAIQDYTKAIELDPNLAIAFNNRGTAYYDKKDYDAAIRDFNKAIELNPNYVNAFNNRGNAYRHKKDYGAAIRDFNKAIELNPNYAMAMANMGLVYFEKGNREKARQWWEEALEKKKYLPYGGEMVRQWIKKLEE